MLPKSKLIFILVVLLIILLTACSPAAAPIPTLNPTVIQTNTPKPAIPPTPQTTEIALPTTTPMVTASPTEKILIVNVGGYDYKLHCYGQGSPTVILENDIAGSLRDWMRVIRDVQPHTRICAYNRPNEDPPNPKVVDTMHALLTNAPLEPPYILVGQFDGAAYAMLYTARYPEEVAGLITLDTFIPELPNRVLAGLPTEFPDESETLKEIRTGWKEGIPWYMPISDPLLKIESLGDVPLVVIYTSDKGCERPIEFTEYLDNSFGKGLLEELANLSTNHTIIWAEKSCFREMLGKDPELVAQQIVKMVETARNQ